MTRKLLLAPLVVLATYSAVGHADPGMAKVATSDEVRMLDEAGVPKSAFASTVGARAYSSSANTVYGGFELAQATTVYIIVRGNSLGSLNITNGYLDAPHVRLYNSAGSDLITQSGYAGFNDCQTANTSTDLPVINYYAARGIPVSSRDTCLAAVMQPGAYTFSVTPSVQNVNNGIRTSGTSGPSAGEILFEVKLGP